MSYRITGIDLHKETLPVVEADLELEGVPRSMRWVSGELILSFVPSTEQRFWRTAVIGYRTRLQKQLEAVLAEAHPKLSSLVPDLLGVSARRILEALADGETHPEALAALAHHRLRVAPALLCDALGACRELNLVYRRFNKMALRDLQFVEQQIGQLNQEIASPLQGNEDKVRWLAEVPADGASCNASLEGEGRMLRLPAAAVQLGAVSVE